MRIKRSTLALVTAAVLSAAAIGTASARPSAASADPVLALQSRFVRVVRQVTPSVVQITTSSGLGSGIVYDGAGHIVTNAHVVGDATAFQVTLASGKRYPGRLVGTYPANDLAVIDIDAPGLRPARFAVSARAQVGEIVLAVGNPLGLRSSVTQGIVSAVARTVSEPNGPAISGLIQTSAAINPGNSGGALVDLSGAVLGIPTLGSTAGSGIGFAIASDTVKRIAAQLIEFGKVVSSGRAYMGVRLGDTTGGGAYVATVEAGSPAARAGLRAGDLIVSLAGTTVGSAQDVAERLANLKPGQKVPVGLLRSDGGRLTVQITLGEAPAS